MAKLYYDFHLHSCLSPCGDDDMTPANIAGMASIIGLNAIAMTDHNSCKNCEALLFYARQLGLLAIPGMELCTAEEVHVLCYFHTLKEALLFQDYVSGQMLPIKNKPEYFGNQLIYNCEDENCGTEDISLITSTQITFFELPDLIAAYHGIMVPAHIDKNSNSLLSNLGFIPENCRFHTVETADISHREALTATHPYLQNCRFLCSSDAHTLTAIHNPEHYLEIPEFSVGNILSAIENAT